MERNEFKIVKDAVTGAKEAGMRQELYEKKYRSKQQRIDSGASILNDQTLRSIYSEGLDPTKSSSQLLRKDLSRSRLQEPTRLHVPPAFADETFLSRNKGLFDLRSQLDVTQQELDNLKQGKARTKDAAGKGPALGVGLDVERTPKRQSKREEPRANFSAVQENQFFPDEIVMPKKMENPNLANNLDGSLSRFRKSQHPARVSGQQFSVRDNFRDEKPDELEMMIKQSNLELEQLRKQNLDLETLNTKKEIELTKAAMSGKSLANKGGQTSASLNSYASKANGNYNIKNMDMRRMIQNGTRNPDLNDFERGLVYLQGQDEDNINLVSQIPVGTDLYRFYTELLQRKEYDARRSGEAAARADVESDEEGLRG
jgi:hypothetical protein